MRLRVERANRESDEQERRRDETVAKAIRRREAEEEFRRWKERMEFDLFLTAGELLTRLERMRADNMPSGPDEPWNEAFCTAVELIPQAKMFLEEMSIRTTKYDGGK